MNTSTPDFFSNLIHMSNFLLDHWPRYTYIKPHVHLWSPNLPHKTCSYLQPFLHFSWWQHHSSMCSGQNTLKSFFTWRSCLHPISQEILLAFSSNYVQILFITHYFHCTFLGLSYLCPLLDNHLLNGILETLSLTLHLYTRARWNF